MTFSSGFSSGKEEWVKSRYRKEKVEQSSEGYRREIKLGQMATSGVTSERICSRKLLSSSHPAFPFLSQSIGKGSSTIRPHQDILRISVAWLWYQPWSVHACRQTLVPDADCHVPNNFSRLPIPQHTPRRGTALLGVPYAGCAGTLLPV